jgi:isopentenyl-diphosphate Delta-isomerase
MIMTGEIMDVVDSDNIPTGVSYDRSIIHSEGHWHRSSRIWIINNSGMVLLQRRAPEKDLFPLFWDVVGGHVPSGGSYICTAVRELREELGILVRDRDLKEIGTWKDDIFTYEFQCTYFLHADIPISAMSLQLDEVTDVRYFEVEEIRRMIDNSSTYKLCYPHQYYSHFISKIKP